MDEKQTLCYLVNMFPTLKVYQKSKKDFAEPTS